MPSIDQDFRSLLGSAGYVTAMPSVDGSTMYFEDRSVMGCIEVFQSISELLERWEHLQDDFLKRNAVRFRKDTAKAWNLYTVLLSTESADSALAARLAAIEEDFRGTRKIARAGINTRTDIAGALAPLLPLAHLVTVNVLDPGDRLAERLVATDESLKALLGDGEPEAMAAAILGGHP